MSATGLDVSDGSSVGNEVKSAIEVVVRRLRARAHRAIATIVGMRLPFRRCPSMKEGNRSPA